MAPFCEPKPVVTGIREKIDSALVQGDRLYLGSSVGNLHIYGVDDGAGSSNETATLVDVKKSVVRRSIEQLGFIRDINSLVILSEMTVTLHSIPAFTNPTPLTQAKAAFSFTVFSHVQHIPKEGTFDNPDARTIPTLITYLVVGCRRKVVIYTWKDGEAQDVKEAPLPHSPRTITFMSSDKLCFAYAPDYAIFDMNTLTATELVLPAPSTTATALGTLTGLTGYMTLGLGAKAKPVVIQLNDAETVVFKDNEGYFLTADGKEARPASMVLPTIPEDIAYVKPYLFNVFPPATIPLNGGETAHPTSVLQIRSSLSLQPAQTIPFPFRHPSTTSTTPLLNATIRVLTPTPAAKSPLYLITTPTDRATTTAEGSTIWRFDIKPWSDQIDELVASENYGEALSLLGTISPPLSDHDARNSRVKALNAVAHFKNAKYDAAIDALKELEVNPAKVVALYPETVAGRLSLPEEQWIPLFGGPAAPKSASPEPADVPVDTGIQKIPHRRQDSVDSLRRTNTIDKDMIEQLSGIPTSASLRGKLRTGLGSLMAATSNTSAAPSIKEKDDDTASVHSVGKAKKPPPDTFRQSIETLVRYLSDHRPKVDAALAANGISPTQAHQYPSLNSIPVEELFELPDVQLSALTPEQLVRFAQVVYTILFKSYLIIRPGLLGALVRLPNWCEVSEVEEELRERKKFQELIDLYHGKKMHARALELLRQLSEDDEDDPTYRTTLYLQKLGPEYMDLVFESSRWLFEVDKDKAFEVFTSEDVELPQKNVADYLEGIDPRLCVRFLEFIINERHADALVVHNRLAELYLSMSLSSKKAADKYAAEVYSKFLEFINTTSRYSADHLYGLVSSTDLYEARAILLGKLGRHDQALEIYAYSLRDYIKAEEYCKQYYEAQSPSTNEIFLTLLKIYLRPTASGDFLPPALGLISRHSPRLDTVETLKLLPPLVTAQEIRTFLTESLRAPIFETRLVKVVTKSRSEQVGRRLMALQTKRVKITDSRICPQCHKRLGSSVVAIHAPRGEVTHFHCREAFTHKVNELRR
ncbi:hypothetical protein CYLTODRAFT_436489 [Cylindrobasidium torrendii FP15055 ss-10]|uniref:CNH domain-containing protein n=1 Tax=Cylindrobasidium torrendii FP15055 ss-10 TaxID=1314674 RepID=A0A0D7BDX4_9AGAR|nr:hypothetical protein CYLTODRAFT_436489 [Cylindrobasidium torrendii FP15055 ss-10]